MKQSEFHTKLAAAWKLAEDTGCHEVVKHCGVLTRIERGMDKFTRSYLEFALAVVEGKAVFVGDELWSLLQNRTYTIGIALNDPQNWSWNPPEPKTVMVELLVEDAEYWVACSNKKLPGVSRYNKASNNFFDAIRAALAKEKN